MHDAFSKSMLLKGVASWISASSPTRQANAQAHRLAASSAMLTELSSNMRGPHAVFVP